MSSVDLNTDQSRGYFGGISVMRAIAALMVVIQHSLYYGAVATGTPYQSILMVGFGDIGVMAFFVISGFVITLNRNLTPSAFMLRRVLRIYPAFWIACAISVALNQAFALPTSVEPWSLLLLPTREFNNTLSIPYWTLIFEMAFYVAAACAIAMRLSDRALAVAALLWILLIQIAGPYFNADITLPKGPGFWILFSPYTQLFCGGVLLCVYRHKVSDIDPILLVLAGVAAYVVVTIFPMPPAPRLMFLCVSYTSLTAASLHIAKVPYIVRRLGDWSYGLYLLHLPILAVGAGNGWFAGWNVWAAWAVLGGFAYLVGNAYGLGEAYLHRRVSKALSLIGARGFLGFRVGG